MQKAGVRIIFDEDGVKISSNEGKAMEIKSMYNVYLTEFTIKCQKKNVAQMMHNRKIDYKLWHQRLGHISRKKFIELKNKDLIEDVELIKFISPNNDLCEACIKGRQARLSFNKKKNRNFLNPLIYDLRFNSLGPKRNNKRNIYIWPDRCTTGQACDNQFWPK